MSDNDSLRTSQAQNLLKKISQVDRAQPMERILQEVGQLCGQGDKVTRAQEMVDIVS